MRLVLAFALTLAACAVVAILCAHEYASAAGRLWDDVARRITNATR